MNCERIDRSEDWNDLIESHGGHPLQLWGWGELKRAYGWDVERYAFYSGPDRKPLGFAQILYRSLPWPLRSLAYVPRGPVLAPGADSAQLFTAVQQAAARSRFKPVGITVEPHMEADAALSDEEFNGLDPIALGLGPGWRRAPEQILIPSTLLLDLEPSEDELLASLRGKTRQSVRRALKYDIELGVCDDGCVVDEVLTIYRETAERAGFALHPDDYYRTLAREMGSNAPIVYARHEGELIGFLWFAASNAVAFELYGGSNNVARKLRTNYALKWHAMKTMKQRGIALYDVNGLLNDSISEFKRGFARHENLLIGSWDYPLSRLYPIWARLLPAARNLRRRLVARKR